MGDLGNPKEDPIDNSSCVERWEIGTSNYGRVERDLDGCPWVVVGGLGAVVRRRRRTALIHLHPLSLLLSSNLPPSSPLRYSLFTQLQTLIVCLVVLTTFLITAFSHPHGLVALSTFRISHAHPIINWFSQGAQDARYSTCFFRMGECKWRLQNKVDR